jgi:hypothetical protein
MLVTMFRFAFVLCFLIFQPSTSGDSLAKEPTHDGLQIFTHQELSYIPEDVIGLRFTGPITSPLAENLSDLLSGTVPKYKRIMLELDSPGGDLEYVKKVTAVLAVVAKTTELNTRVLNGQMCASGCIPVYMQGAKRKASGASVWMFHGASNANTNVPSPEATREYLDLLVGRGVEPDFVRQLVDSGYVSKPGKYWLSGYELFHVHAANIITELLPPWVPEQPWFAPATPMMGIPFKERFWPVD